MLSAVLLPAMWGYVEVAQVRGRDPSVGQAIITVIRYCIAWGALMITLRLFMGLALHYGLPRETWIPIGRQLMGGILGIGLILFGNALPKLRSPWSYPDQPFDWQHVHRFVGWLCVIAGVVITLLWLVSPGPVAGRTTFVVMTITAVLSVGRKFASLFSSRHRSIAP